MLAGPILRRVTPRSVSVWVALRDSKDVLLRVWEGERSDSSGNKLFTADEPLLQSEQIKARRIGDHLHLAVVTVEVKAGQPSLTPGRIYAYNVAFLNGAAEDLKSQKLLQEGPLQADKAHRPHVPLGYARDTLPTFALPPEAIAGLQLAHGSNRKVHGGGPDALAFLDRVIGENRNDPAARPHQLLLTGNQIYGDDVALPLLPILNKDAVELISGSDSSRVERIPVGDELLAANARNFPAGRRRDFVRRPNGEDDEVRVTSSTADNHLLSFGEYCMMHLYAWSNAVWPKDLASFSSIESTPSPPQTIRQRLSPKQRVDALESQHAQELEHIEAFRATLPSVRRVLANVPTYMTWGNHEITDDLNLNRLWRDRMLSHPLGRTIMRNGMLAYALFQAWGNDPAAFELEPNKQLFTHVNDLYPGNAHGPNESKASALEKLFGLDRSTIAEPRDSDMRWHYSVPGAQFNVLVLDTFTQRAFEGTYVPPAPLSEFALVRQVPERAPDTGTLVTLVVSSSPVLGLPVIEEFFTPVLNRLHDISTRIFREDSVLAVEDRNPQTWAFNAASFEALLKRLSPYGRVVFLSGEMRHSMCAALTYWRRAGPPEPIATDKSEEEQIAEYNERFEQNTIFAQLVSSALNDQHDPPDRYLYSSPLAQFVVGNVNTILRDSIIGQPQSPSNGQVGDETPEPLADNRLAQFVLGTARARIERLGWDAIEPGPITVQDGVIPTKHRQRTRRAPVLLTPLGWPAGTTVHRLPEWAWRFRLIGDPRPDAERPAVIQPPPLFPDDAENPNKDVTTDLDGYRRVARRHAAMFRKSNPRILMFTSNIAIAQFSGIAGTNFRVHNTLLTMQPDTTTPQVAEPCMVHTIELEPELTRAPPADGSEPDKVHVPRIVSLAPAATNADEDTPPQALPGLAT